MTEIETTCERDDCDRPGIHPDGLCAEHHEEWHRSLDEGWSDDG